MKAIIQLVNPFRYLGVKRYSAVYPLIVMIFVNVLSEIYAYGIARNPLVVGVYIIFIHAALIIYFAFRDGKRGGLIATLTSVLYYFYIISTRKYTGQQLITGIETTIVLGIIFMIIGYCIGYLKETVDTLIENEANERRRLQAIIDQLPVGVLITDSKGNVVQGNKYIKYILGKEMLQNRVIGHHRHLPPNNWPLAQTLMTGKSVSGKEFIYRRDDGKELHLSVSASIIKNKQGQMIAAASIVNDITNQKEIENRKDDFIKMASHELKTPITSLKLYMQALELKIRQVKNPGLSKTVSHIRYQVDKLQELVSDLLDVSKIQTGKIIFSKERFDLSDLVKETVRELQQTSTKHTIRLQVKQSAVVTGDRFRIYQVLANLLTNAMKYSPNGGNILVTAIKEKHSVVVCVQDFGIGIDKTHQRKIFERLYQVTDSKEKVFSGLGLGLYISHEIIRRHKGKIWVESQKGKGSRFYFSIPFR